MLFSLPQSFPGTQEDATMHRSRRLVAIARILLPLIGLSSPLVLADQYQVTTIPVAELSLPRPQLPDLSAYTPHAVRQLADQARQAPAGTARVGQVKEMVEMRVLYSGDGMLEMGLQQGDIPSALLLEHGVMTLKELHQAYPKLLVQVGEEEYLAKLPLVVGIDATLLLEDTVLKMSEEAGSFLVNGGKLFIIGGALLGWRESENGPAIYSGDRDRFRPFLVSWGGSETYLSETRAAHLGYFNTKTYGVTFASYEYKPNEKLFQNRNFDFKQPPRGWLINSTFSDIYYGFYCYEAEDVAIVGNDYVDNIIYAIDPHDRSSNLLIANNRTHGTQVKHGIIVSRDVKDSFIIGNETYDNKLSGIMLDRQSTGNQVVGNTVHHNGSDGITLYESGDNLVANNRVFANASHGIRLRNSANVTILDNLVVDNASYGVLLHTADLSAHTKRDLVMDPYEQKVSGILAGGMIAYNGSGSVFIDNTCDFRIYDVEITPQGDKSARVEFGGDLARYQQDIIRSLWRDHGVASLQLLEVP
jgi:mannuronan 5-epimerase